jgi:hypothetical protein
LAIITNNVHEIMTSIQQYSPANSETTQDVLQASTTAISLLKDQLLNLQPHLSMMTGIEPMLETLSRELSNAVNHVKGIEELVAEHNSKSEPRKHRNLSSQGIPMKDLPHRSSISKADYLLRAQSRHLQRDHNIGKSFESQQGYHPARESRQQVGEGHMHRRLDPDNKQCVHDTASAKKYKEAQCLRLAECAKNYNLYDGIVYFFGDDIDLTTGSISDDEKITVSKDLLNIPTKVRF